MEFYETGDSMEQVTLHVRPASKSNRIVKMIDSIP